MFNDFEITYGVWKLIVDDNGYKTYHIVNGSDNVKAITGNRDMIYWSHIDSEDYSDWDTNYGASSSEESCENDAYAKIYGLTTKQTPRNSDGTPFVLPTTFGKDLDVHFNGRGDDVTNGNRLRGSRFQLTQTDTGTNTFEWQYIKPVYLSGGTIIYSNSVLGDWVRYEIYAPATVATDNAGAGVYDKVPSGLGPNVFIPNATQQGDYDLDLTEKLNDNVDFLKVNPIPSFDNTGFFNYDVSNQTISLNAQQGGNCNLFDQDFVLIEIVNDDNLLGSRMKDFLVPASFAAKKIFPQWKHKVTLNRSTTGTLELCWNMLIGRNCARP